jgi:hypothetical protein
LPPKVWRPTPWASISLSTKFIEGNPRADVAFLAAAVAGGTLRTIPGIGHPAAATAP